MITSSWQWGRWLKVKILREQELRRVWRRSPVWSQSKPVCPGTEEGNWVQTPSALPAVGTTRKQGRLNPSGACDCPHVFIDCCLGRRWREFSVFTSRPSDLHLSKCIWAPDETRYNIMRIHFFFHFKSDLRTEHDVSSFTFVICLNISVKFSSDNNFPKFQSDVRRRLSSLFKPLDHMGECRALHVAPNTKRGLCQPTSAFKLGRFSQNRDFGEVCSHSALTQTLDTSKKLFGKIHWVNQVGVKLYSFCVTLRIPYWERRATALCTRVQLCVLLTE